MMNRRTKILLIPLFFLFTCVCAQDFEEEEEEDCGRYARSRLSLATRQYKGMGFDRGYSTVSLFLCRDFGSPLYPFFDARLHVFNDGYLASNVGFGTRVSNAAETYSVGCNIYYDYRNYKSISVHQGAGGLELLTKHFGIYLNGYYPFSGKTSEGNKSFSNFSGHSAYYKQTNRFALPSADAQISFTLPEPFSQIGLHLDVGYYYLFKQKLNQLSVGNAPGVLGRIRIHPADYITFEGEYTHDKVFGSRTNGTIAFHIRLGPKKPKNLRASIYPYTKSVCDLRNEWMQVQSGDVLRNEIVPIASPIQKQQAFGHFIFVNNDLLSKLGPSGNGTFENPYTTLALGQENSAPGDYVYVFFGDGTSSGYDTGFNFKTHQTLTSSAINLSLPGFSVPALTPGLLPTVTNTELSPVIEASNIRSGVLQGFTLEGLNDTTVLVNNSDMTITNNVINNDYDFSAITLIDSPGTTRIQMNTIQSTGISDPVISISNHADGLAGLYTIERNTIIANNGINGIKLQNVYEKTNITQNTFIASDPSGSAVFYSTTGDHPVSYRFDNNLIVQGFNFGVFASINNPYQLAILNNQISTGTLEDGIIIGTGSNGAIDIEGNIILTSSAAVLIEDAAGVNTACHISSNQIVSQIDAGMRFIIHGDIETSITNNYVEATLTGIALELSQSPGLNKARVDIESNVVSVGGSGISGIHIINSGAGVFVAHVANNEVMGGEDKVIDIDNSSTNSVCLSLIGNKNVPRFILKNDEASAQLQVFAPGGSEEGLKAINNPTGNYQIIGNVVFADPLVDCPD